MADKKDIKLVVVIQCSMAKKRCSGYLCMNVFFNREDFFKDYPSDKNVRFLPVECGGCCGKSVNAVMTNISRKMAKTSDLKKDEVAVHLSSCMCFDNHHSDRCMFIDKIKEAVKKQGFTNIFEGSKLSKTAERRRAEGIYKTY